MKIKKLDKWLAHIESFHPNEIELGLERIKSIATEMDLLRFDARIVTVGGTNGKGSCVATLEALAKTAGLKFASYTSPHLISFNERIRINGLPISDSSLVKAFEIIETTRGNTALTFFEFTTLAALYSFKQAPLDLIVLEVGLGGRLDAVNIVEPDVSVVTTIDKDHESWLGSELTQIAKEKFGIFRKQNTNFVGDKKSLQLATDLITSAGYKVETSASYCESLISSHQLDTILKDPAKNPNRLLLQNIQCAIAAFSYLFGNKELLKSVDEVFEAITIQGRFQQLSTNPITIVDVGHNVQAGLNLANQIATTDCEGTRIAICGLMADKAISEFLQVLDPVIDEWLFVDLPINRAASGEELMIEYTAKGLNKPISNFSSVHKAYESVLQKSSGEIEVYVIGSFITVSEMLQYFDKSC